MLSILYETLRLVLFYINIFQRVLDLQSGHEIKAQLLSNIAKGDNAKSKKSRIAILVRDRSSRPVLHFYEIPSKYPEGYLNYRADIKSTSKTKQRDITPVVRKPELSFLYATRLPVLFYIFTKYH